MPTPPSGISETGGMAAPATQSAAPTTTPAPPARTRYVVVAYLLVAVGVTTGVAVHQVVAPPSPVVVPGISVFAGFYVVAQAVERVIDPFSNRAGGVLDGFGRGSPGPRPKKEDLMKHRRWMRQRAAGADTGSETHTKAVEAADAVALFRANSTVLMWGVACLLASLLCGWLGLLMLHAVGVHAPVPVDLAVTGVGIGSGTKPLHDLIGNLAATKQKKQDSA
jgi:hypothetical protein